MTWFGRKTCKRCGYEKDFYNACRCKTMTPKSDAELLSGLDTAITDYGPGDSNDCIVYMTVGQARALRSRLTAETGVRDGALEEAANVCHELAKDHERRAVKKYKQADASKDIAQHHAALSCMEAVRALKLPPAPKGE